LIEWTVAADVVHAMKLLATHPKIDRRQIATIDAAPRIVYVLVDEAPFRGKDE